MAQSKITEYCQKIKTGDIIVVELKRVSSKIEHFKKLCSAADAPQEGQIEQLLQDRINEEKFFSNRKTLLTTICQHLTITIEGNYKHFS